MQVNTINIKADKYSSHSNTNLFIILSKRHSLYNMYLETTVTRTRIQINTRLHLSFRILQGTDFSNQHIGKIKKISFTNKGLDAFNVGNILYLESVQSKIQSFLKDQFVPIMSYLYQTICN